MPQRILIVDDDPANIELLEVMFGTFNVEVCSATLGSQALEMARDRQPSLIVLDAMLADMTGFEVCAQLKAEPATAHIPIAMLTGRIDEAARRKADEVGADHFLVKPVMRADLRVLLDSTLK
ncbi:MAG: response regulator [Chloroflexota bacterium]|nr:MAG: response regulator [Chloroflexota bacterium]